MRAKNILLFLAILAITIAPAMAGPDKENHKIGAVYTETNNVTDNRIISFERSADGSLSMSGSFSTNGLGTGVSLGNQGGVILTDDGKYLLAVDAGSNEISVFQVKKNGNYSDTTFFY
ncbi:Uncharacterised protein [uncultured archaeon]|nr:Uncharacterised protein [uncultured archaeon]